MSPRSDLPWVTIVTPSLNQGPFIRQAIESVLAQTYPNIEYIIMDAGSTDETATVVADYRDRLLFISEPDRGQSHAINKGWRMAKGTILSWLCADDFLVPSAVAQVVEQFERHPEASFVFGGCETIDLRDLPTGVMLPVVPDTWKLIHGYDYVPQPSAFASRAAVEAVGFVDESLHFGMDWDLFMRLSLHGPVVPISALLSTARIYPETKSSSGGYRRWRELVGIMRRHGEMRYPPAYFLYGAEMLRESTRRFGRRMPSRLVPLQSFVRRSLDRWLQSVLAAAMTKASGGWFADKWASDTLVQRIDADGRTLALQGRLPPEYPELAGQQLTVTCEGEILGVRDLAPGPFSWELPMPPMSSASRVEIRVRAQRSFVPKRAGMNGDTRRLAFYLDELSVS
ncbi:MAG: glycosyltransferase [Actinobacteria bacterium]|nr:glycosyltransferase [Actinomycetota bacterium]